MSADVLIVEGEHRDVVRDFCPELPKRHDHAGRDLVVDTDIGRWPVRPAGKSIRHRPAEGEIVVPGHEKTEGHGAFGFLTVGATGP